VAILSANRRVYNDPRLLNRCKYCVGFRELARPPTLYSSTNRRVSKTIIYRRRFIYETESVTPVGKTRHFRRRRSIVVAFIASDVHGRFVLRTNNGNTFGQTYCVAYTNITLRVNVREIRGRAIRMYTRETR